MEPAPEKVEVFEPSIVEPSKDELVNVPLQDEKAEIVRPPEVAPAEAEAKKASYAVLVNSVHTVLFDTVLGGSKKVPAEEWKKARSTLDSGGVMLCEKYDKLGLLDKYLPELTYIFGIGIVAKLLMDYSPKDKKKKKSEAEDTEDTEPEDDKRIEAGELASIEEQKKAYEAKQKQQG